MEIRPVLFLLRFDFNSFCASEPMRELTGSELRRWHGRTVTGILLAGGVAFAPVFWITVLGHPRVKRCSSRLTNRANGRTSLSYQQRATRTAPRQPGSSRRTSPRAGRLSSMWRPSPCLLRRRIRVRNEVRLGWWFRVELDENVLQGANT